MKKWSRRTRSLEDRFWEKVDVRGRNECWLWTASLQNGYGQIGIKGQRSPGKAHRVSWELHHGVIPEGLEVLHTCDNPRCVNPRHLFLGSQTDNLEDMTGKGRRRQGNAFGADNPSSKLTEKDVRKIRRLVKSGWTHGKLAKIYGVSRPAISAIIRGETWYWVTDD